MQQGLSGQYGGLSDIDNAKRIAKRIFDMYDNDKSGAIEAYEIHHMMRDAYKTINKSFEPSKADIDSYIDVLDRDNDGLVTLSDIEQLVIRFLVGEDYHKFMVTKPQQQTWKPNTENQLIDQYLEQARNMFKKYDVHKLGLIDETELGALLIDTYKQLGQDYQPTQEDLNSFMNIVDPNNEGKIKLEDYEQIVMKSLQQA